MWRLKIGEGGNDPYLYSTNNFLGRQTWEFDPNIGIAEERAEVEEARLNFYNNRYNVQPSSDLLWQMQFLREKKMQQTISQPKIEDGEEVTYEDTTAAVKRSAHLFSALQSKHGHWPAENSGPMFCFPPLVMSLYITGHLNTIFSPEHRKEILRYIYYHQNEDGGWGLYIGGQSTMFCTALNYICMRLLGVGPDGGLNNACERARKWILDRGGVPTIPSWGKTWLSAATECLRSFGSFLLMFPLIQILHRSKDALLLPINLPANVLFLRQELHTEPYNEIDWSKKRHLCAKEDLHYPHTLLQILLWDSLYLFSEPFLNRWPFNKLRKKSLKVAMDIIHYEDESSRYITIGCVEKPLCMLACWVEDPNGIYFKKHLARIDDYVWVGEDGIKMQGFGSQVWDTSFLLQALLASNLYDEIGLTLMKGHDFLKNSQVRDNPSGDFKRMFRHISKGSWTFSDGDHGWQVSDCTAESLKCCVNFALMAPEMVGNKMEDEQFYDAVNSKNGGYTVWEPAGGAFWWEALAIFKKLYPGHRKIEIENCIRKAAKFIEDVQYPDGKNFKNCLAIRKGVEFLLKTQREDGGWGESYLSCPKRGLTAVFMRNCMLHFALYRSIFPLWALAEYRNHVWPSKHVCF
ncbi:hypothetical protein CXB51_016051 [Gossypium anomalum]|uniref:Terpene cyclase/mutase family member n=1 Tax=Gossypium anomalum TaxID=47600 RepID=A0A8J6D030_9ROSI|nr:hypothetical protein CXB51_016051 [Gossypium anomalum]